jgi:hypothetical protein
VGGARCYWALAATTDLYLPAPALTKGFGAHGQAQLTLSPYTGVWHVTVGRKGSLPTVSATSRF